MQINSRYRQQKLHNSASSRDRLYSNRRAGGGIPTLLEHISIVMQCTAFSYLNITCPRSIPQSGRRTFCVFSMLPFTVFSLNIEAVAILAFAPLIKALSSPPTHFIG